MEETRSYLKLKVLINPFILKLTFLLCDLKLHNVSITSGQLSDAINFLVKYISNS